MNKQDIILIGGGGHCVSCIEVIESSNQFNIVGIIDDKSKIGEKVLGYSIIGCDDDLKSLKEKYDYAFITVGQIKSNKARVNIYHNLLKLGYKLPSIIASSAIVSKHTTIGDGSIIMHQAIVNANTTIGSNCIINSKALIEHDCKIGSHTHISTNATLNGNVTVGDNCFIGSSSSFVNGISITDNIFIGINSLVSKNLENKGVYIGSPVKKIK